MSSGCGLWLSALLLSAISSGTGISSEDFELEDLVDMREMASGLEEPEHEIPAGDIQTPKPQTKVEEEILQHLFGKDWDQPDDRRPCQQLSPYLLPFLQTIQTKTIASLGGLLDAMPEDKRPNERSTVTRLVGKYEKMNWISRQTGPLILEHKGLVAICYLFPYEEELDQRSKKRFRLAEPAMKEKLDGIKQPEQYYYLLSACKCLAQREKESGVFFTTDQIKVATRLQPGANCKFSWDNLFATALNHGWLLKGDGYALASENIDQVIEALKTASQNDRIDQKQPAPQKKARINKLKEINLPALRHKDIYLGLLDQLTLDNPRTNHVCLQDLKPQTGSLPVQDQTILGEYFKKLETAEWVEKRKAGKTCTYVITQKGVVRKEELRKLVNR
jgi:hypothetical protein